MRLRTKAFPPGSSALPHAAPSPTPSYAILVTLANAEEEPRDKPGSAKLVNCGHHVSHAPTSDRPADQESSADRMCEGCEIGIGPPTVRVATAKGARCQRTR